jgi:hypothetical protein
MKLSSDFDTEAEHAAWIGKDARTLRRLRQLPDGLPYTTAGRTILYKREWTLAWLEARKTVNNPTPPARARRRDRGHIEALESQKTVRNPTTPARATRRNRGHIEARSGP